MMAPDFGGAMKALFALGLIVGAVGAGIALLVGGFLLSHLSLGWH